MRLVPFEGFSFGKMWKNMEKHSFFGQPQLDLGNTAPVAMVRLGLKG